MRRAQLVILTAVVAAVAAWAVPGAMAGIGTSRVQVISSGSGSGTITGFGLSGCTITNGVLSGGCVTGELMPSQYILTATAAAGSTLVSMPGCPGSFSTNSAGGFCTFFTDGIQDYVIGVNFSPSTRTLTVTKSGTGTATVTSSPGGINCGTVCTASFVNGTVVRLTVTLTGGTTFNGWGGACAPSGRNLVCLLSMTANRTVSISTTLSTFTLSVTTAGSGSGTVTSNPAGINCPPTCSAAVVNGTTVSLIGNPAAGSVLSGFSGACNGPTCNVQILNGPASVTATFALAQVDAAVVGNRIVQNGPPRARRVINVTVNADEEISIVMRIQRSGVTLQTRRIRSFGPDDGIVRFPISNAIASGKAKLLVTMENEFGVDKSQTRNLKIPSVA
jgi:Divergent InlB B-repeat domain